VFAAGAPADVRSVFRDFHHLELTDAQMRKLVAR
jgi:hypothetical protein